MRIGLSPLEGFGGPLGASAGTPGPQCRPKTASPIRLSEADVTPPAIFGGCHVDFDHQ